MGSVEKYIFTPASSVKLFLIGHENTYFFMCAGQNGIPNDLPTPDVSVVSVSMSETERIFSYWLAPLSPGPCTENKTKQP